MTPGCSQAVRVKVQIREDSASGSQRETLTQTPGNTFGNCGKLRVSPGMPGVQSWWKGPQQNVAGALGVGVGDPAASQSQVAVSL